MSNKRTGLAFIEIDGNVYESMKDSSLDDVMGIEATAVVGVQVYGYSDEPKATVLNAKFVIGNGITSDDIKNITDSEGQFICDTGENYLLTGLFRMSAKLDPAGHVLDCKLGMTSCTPLT